MSEEKELGDSYFIKHDYCVASELKKVGVKSFGNQDFKDCNSSDGLALYEEDVEDGVTYSGYCWSCKQSFNAKHLAKTSLSSDLGLQDEGVVIERKDFERKPKQKELSKEDVIKLIKEVGYTDKTYRGIRPETLKFFGHLAKHDRQGNIKELYYPETVDGGGNYPKGYKIRYLPKYFGKVGQTGLKSQLSGQIKFKDYKNQRDVLLVGGENDKAAAFQMLRDNQIRKNQEDYAPVAVVSMTTGEGSAVKQVRSEYDFLDGFENIILGLDNDEVGIEAMKYISEILPKEKVKIAYWTLKDPHKMLEEGKERQFMSDFYNAKPIVDDGIITSSTANDSIEEELSRPKITLPSFMCELEDCFAGGIPLGYWVNWIAMSGAGKTTTVNEAIRKWVYESPYKVGILSLELTAAQYMIAMLSREVGHKINLIRNPNDALEFLKQPHVVDARDKLRINEYGEDRFVLIDDREGSLDNVKLQIERLIKKHGCKLIVIDPLNDLFDAASWDEQSAFIRWMKITVKQGVTFSCVCHVRKGGSSTDKDGKRIVRELTEDDVSGLSLITKSAGANVFLTRNKYAEDDVERNTTKVTLGKCRWTGITGDAGKWYYDNKTHTMYDYKTHIGDDDNGELF